MYAFVHIDKTGGTTVTSILRRELGTRHCDIRLPLIKRRDDSWNHRSCIEASDLQRVSRLYRNLAGISGHNVRAYSNLQSVRSDISYFTVLRDPLSRYRSQFLNRAPSQMAEGFAQWTGDELTHNWQTRMIAGEPNAEKAIDLLSTRFGLIWLLERFDEGLVLLAQWLGEPGFSPQYQRQNQLSAKHRPRDIERKEADLSYLEADSARARMREINVEDQKVYDYVATTLYPRQTTNYQGDLALDTQTLKSRNQSVVVRNEPLSGRVMRNYVYKPLLHCHAI